MLHLVRRRRVVQVVGLRRGIVVVARATIAFVFGRGGLEHRSRVWQTKCRHESATRLLDAGFEVLDLRRPGLRRRRVARRGKSERDVRPDVTALAS